MDARPRSPWARLAKAQAVAHAAFAVTVRALADAETLAINRGNWPLAADLAEGRAL
jgi:hypothetical protein